MKIFRILQILLGSLVFALSLRAQVTTGFPPMGSFSSNTFDSIDNANLNVHFSIPIVSKAGRGMGFDYSLNYDNSVWQRLTSSWFPTNSFTSWGWRQVTDASTGMLSYSDTPSSCEDNIGDVFFFDIYDSWVYYDQQGTPHSFGSLTISTYNPTWKCGTGYPPKTAGGAATDPSGYRLSAAIDSHGNPSGTIFDLSGNTIVARLDPSTSSPISAYTVTDPNQNKISVTTDGLTFTDTIGSAVLTTGGSGTPTSPRIFTYKGPGGASEQVKVYYVQKTVQTAFGCSGVSEYSASANLVSEIDLADIGTNPNDKYTFTYETTPGHSPNVTGRIASVTLPTGGTITYSYSGGSNGITCGDGSTPTLTRITPDGTWTYAHIESGNAWTTTITDPGGNKTVINFQGVIETERKAYQGASTLLATVDTCYNGAAIPCTNTAITAPINNRTVQTTLPTVSPSKTYTTYNSNSLPTEIDEYTYGGTSPVRSTVYSYATLNGWIRDRPSTIQVKSGATVVAQTAFTNYDSVGNVGTVTYTGQNMSALAKSFIYGGNGLVSTITDVNGAQTTVTYQTCNGGNAYPSTFSLPLSLSVTENWNCDGGVLNSITDANSQQTGFQYDALWQRTTTSFPDGGSVTDSYSPTQISSLTSITGSTSRTDTTDLDGLGRVKDQTIRGVTTRTSYDALGRMYVVSIDNSGGAQDTYAYDALGRVTGVTHADGNTISTDWTTNPQCPKTTDEAGKTNQVCSDALGRVTKVVDGLGNTTLYTYDVLNDLTGVTQGAQTRTYAYDGLGRLLSATTPESGQTSYTYNSGGDLATRVDARGITACYGNWTGSSCDTSLGYDGLHRLLEKSYSDGTPSSTYYYDLASVWGQNTTNAKGRLVVANENSGSVIAATAIPSYDAMGRITYYRQCTPYNCGTSDWQMAYTYDLAGDMTSYTNPAGFTITNQIDQNQRITQVTSTLIDSTHPQYLAKNITYTPWGALATILDGCASSSGQEAGCTDTLESYVYNTRLQPIFIELGKTGSPTAYSCLVYGRNWNTAPPSGCAGGPAPQGGNNGDIIGYYYQDSVNTSLSHQATYTYDGLNRLTQAVATGNAAYNLTFNYDQYGNMTCNTLANPNGPCPSVTYSSSTNQIHQIGSLFAGYDSAGNMTSDGTNTYQYDGEGRLKSVNNGSTEAFTYNALGQQVQVSWAGGAWNTLFDPSGLWMGRNTAGHWDVGGVFHLGGRQFGIYIDQFYGLHENVLGSSDSSTNAAGGETGQTLFYPWGQTWSLGSAAWNFSAFEYGSPPPILPPTLFRTYDPDVGRWMTPDPMGMAASDTSNPQSWNLYAYVTNNPTTLTDPLGLFKSACDNPTYAQAHSSCANPNPIPVCSSSDPFYSTCDPGPWWDVQSPGGRGVGGGAKVGPASPPKPKQPDTRQSCGSVYLNALAEWNTSDHAETTKQVAEAGAGAAAAESLKWQMERLLVVPFRSPYVRLFENTSRVLAEASEVVPLVFATIAFANADFAVAKARVNGACRAGF